MRLFVAVNFEARVLDAIEHALATFPVSSPPWRWAARDNWHVTLKFMGETDPDRVGYVAAALDTVAAAHAPFDMRLGALGGFPNLGRPRVIFYHAEKGESELTALAQDVDEALSRAMGLPPETRPFRAHATVARVKTPVDRETASQLGAAPALVEAVQRVAGFDLMESRLGRSGATYTRVKAFALSGGA